MKNLVICFTGSVATIKDKLLYEWLIKHYNISLHYSYSSLHFSQFTDEERNDKILYKEINKILNWADLILISPLSAHTLAKISLKKKDTFIVI